MSLPWRLRDRLLARRALAARDGDEAAMRALYRELYPEIARFVGRRIRIAADAEDLVSRVFFTLVERLDDFDPKRGNLRGWLFRIARNAIIDHLRKQRPTLSYEPLGEFLPAEIDDPLSELLDRERLTHLLLLLEAQPPATRELLALRYGDGLRHREIAAITGISEAAVKQRVSRAVRDLRSRVQRSLEKGEADAVVG
ncbi:MAG TPA: sigma-70 family RNA polymerase sigma factor [Nannocystis exedens]|nr:sigma-70 family RNA polymerase sigma factor [Nannocystis exedens]